MRNYKFSRFITLRQSGVEKRIVRGRTSSLHCTHAYICGDISFEPGNKWCGTICAQSMETELCECFTRFFLDVGLHEVCVIMFNQDNYKEPRGCGGNDSRRVIRQLCETPIKIDYGTESFHGLRFYLNMVMIFFNLKQNGASKNRITYLSLESLATVYFGFIPFLSSVSCSYNGPRIFLAAAYKLIKAN